MPKILSLQKGTFTLTSAGTTTTVNPVSTGNTLLLYSANVIAANCASAFLGGTLTDSETITWARYVGGSDLYVSWYLIEFDSSVTVQRGVTDLSAASTNVTIDAVTLANAFAIGNRLSDSYNASASSVCQFILNSTTNLNIRAYSSPSGTEKAYWQVVECAAFAVQQGTIDLSSATSNTATISAVDTGQTFLVGSIYSSLNGDEIKEMLSYCELTNSTTVTGYVNTSGYSNELHFYAVDVQDAGTSVQSGTATFNSGTGAQTKNITISSIDTTRSVPLMTGAFGAGGESATNSDIWSDGLPRARITSATNLELYATWKPTTSDFVWQVIQFELQEIEADPGQTDLALSATAPTRTQTTTENKTPASKTLALSATAPTATQTTGELKLIDDTQLALSTTAPTVARTTEETKEPATKDAALSGSAPTVTQTTTENKTPAAASMLTSSVAPAATQTTSESDTPAAKDAVLSSVAPTVTQTTSESDTPAATPLALSSVAPTVTQTTSESDTPAAAALALSATAPTATRTTTLEALPAAKDAVLSSVAPTVTQTTSESDTPAATPLALSSVAPTLTQTTIESKTPASGNIVLFPYAPTVTHETSEGKQPAAASLALSSSAASVEQTTTETDTPSAVVISLSSFAPIATQTTTEADTPGAADAALSSIAPTLTSTMPTVTADAALSSVAPNVVVSSRFNRRSFEVDLPGRSIDVKIYRQNS